MGSSVRSYLITLLLYVSVVNEISLPVVTCQDEEGDRCLPRKTFFALLRLPEVSPNLAAYSRTARIIQDAKNRNEIVNLKTLSSEDNEDAEICLPVGVYLDLFSDPALRGHLTAVGRAQKMFEDPTTRTYLTNEDLEAEAEEELNSEKRSIATLAKNGDLPISIQDKGDEEDEEEKRSLTTLVQDGSLSRDDLEALLGYSEMEKRNIAALARDYALPNGKRNVASLARDFALPQTNSAGGKRNVAALARDFALPSGKRNVATLARDFALPPSGKRNIAALARDYALPSGKRNIAALARDYSLPYGKRYLDIFSRGSAPRFQPSSGDKRNLAALVRNGDLPMINYKRNIAALAREWTLPTQNRYGRSLDTLEAKAKVADREGRLREISNEGDASGYHDNAQKIEDEDANERKLEALASSNRSGSKSGDSKDSKKDKSKGKSSGKKVVNGKRPKRQIDFSNEYPLPVMQNTNVLDYEEMIEALTGEYPNTEKRFMEGPPMEMNAENDEVFYVSPPVKKHIGALARQGWLPSFRTARFSRSPRYLVNREDSADGSAADDPTNPSARSLGFGHPSNRYSRSQHVTFGDCRHGFKRFFLVPAVDKQLLLNKLYTTPRNL